MLAAISGFAILVLSTHLSRADDAGARGLQTSAILAFTSDYTYRGVSLNDERPTPMLYIEASYGSFYFNGLLIGTELGTDELGRDIGTIETDGTIGWLHSFGLADINAGVKYTGYPNGRDIVAGTLDRAERDFIEPFAGITLRFSDKLSLVSTLYWTPDYYYETGAVTTAEAQLTYVLPPIGDIQPKFTALAGVARSEYADVVSPGSGYRYFNTGFEARVERLIFDLRYWDTDVEDIDGYERRFVFSAGVVFN